MNMQALAVGKLIIYISFIAVMIWSLLRLAPHLSTVFTSSGMELKGKWKSWAFIRPGFLLYQCFFLDNFGLERTWKLGRRDVSGGHKFVDNSGEGVTVRKLKWWRIIVLAEFPSQSSWTLNSTYIIGYNSNVSLVWKYLIFYKRHFEYQMNENDIEN